MKELRRFTIARVGLGRAGNSIPVHEMLEFQLAHARARDAVSFPFDSRSLCEELNGIPVKSAARDRAEYLRRPDLGASLTTHRERGWKRCGATSMSQLFWPMDCRHLGPSQCG